jgi:hypothetical protein
LARVFFVGSKGPQVNTTTPRFRFLAQLARLNSRKETEVSTWPWPMSEEEVNSQQSSPPEDLPSVTTISESDLAEFAAPFLPFLSEPFPAAPAESRAAPRPGLLLASSFAVDPVNLEKFVLQYARYLVRLQNWIVNVYLLEYFVCLPT